MPKITVSMPCYLRPQRTERAIKSILKQTEQDWEAFVMWDGDRENNLRILMSGILSDQRFHPYTLFDRCGHWGYKLTNYSIQAATGDYFLFMANDDYISPDHFQNYLSEIEGTGLDFVYFDYMVLGKKHKTKMAYGKIGDNALIIRTKFLQAMPARLPVYGHDWTLIENMIKSGAKYKKSKNPPTYHIMSSPKNRIDMEGLD